jgi:hypothetical protein
MMGILNSGTRTMTFTPDQLKRLIAADLGVPAERVAVEYAISETGPQQDPYKAVTGIIVRVTDAIRGNTQSSSQWDGGGESFYNK